MKTLYTSNINSPPVQKGYIDKFGKFPSRFTFESKLDRKKVFNYFNTKYKIEDVIKIREKSSFKTDNIIFSIPREEIIIAIFQDNENDHKIHILYNANNLDEKYLQKEFIDPIKKCAVKDEKNEFHMVIVQYNDFALKSCEIKDPEIDFSLNYEKGFKKMDKKLKSHINENSNKGIALLHGPPGTGKTMYIRHLICNLNKDKIIYLPPKLVGKLSDPDFTSFLMGHKNSLLIIEDAEKAIEQRKGNQGFSISNLLNMADGLLSDALKMQILATFNTDIKNIDEALLRKGRLICKYKFNYLSTEKANHLAKHLGKNIKFEKPQPLSSIYNIEGEDEAKKQKLENKKTIKGFIK